jgi:hypothetical protein
MTDADFGPEWSASLRRGDEAELNRWLEFALDLCDMADVIALGAFRRDLVIETKPDRTFVTQADRGIEQELRARIADVFRIMELSARSSGPATRTPASAGTSTRSMAPTTSCAGCPCSAR